MPNGPLEGLRVLDFTQALAGPFATQILADIGAEVVKVEMPDGGDMSRLVGPFMPEDVDQRHSGYFHSINRNKRSIVVNLKSPEGRDIVLQLVKQYDVVVENFRAGVMERLGLSYEVLREHNPRLVYAAIRGFGDPRSGKSQYVDWPSYDVIAQAMGGIMGITGQSAGHPSKIGPGVGDTVPALFLTIGIMGAVYRARATGRGQFVDVSMVDAILAICERIIYQRSFAGIVPTPEGNHHPFIAPFGVYPASDGHIALACPNDQFFRDLCNALGVPELPDSPQWNTIALRNAGRERLIGIISALTIRFSKEELIARLGGRVPCGPIYNVDDILSDPYFAARGMIAEIECAGLETPKKVAGVPIKFSETPGSVRHSGPGHGEHTSSVLEEAGFQSRQIEAWYAAGIVK
jgi:crotonobetainyl-CoA:carnitine CoA-transferase CaiB-like acyl-CoA transferase